jgi:hypothetical protein
VPLLKLTTFSETLWWVEQMRTANSQIEHGIHDNPEIPIQQCGFMLAKTSSSIGNIEPVDRYALPSTTSDNAISDII